VTLLLHGNAQRLPLADDSVDVIITSPPFFHLRDYGMAGQLGLEPTPAAYLAALWAVTHEMVRVLKPGGSLWVHLGDKYSGFSGEKWSSARSLHGGGRVSLRGMPTGPIRAPDVWGIPNKSLIGLPWAYALGATGMLAALTRGLVDAELCRRLLRHVSYGWLSLQEAEELLDQAAAVGGADPGLRLILRREVIWWKESPLPESVGDRPPTVHEFLFCFTKRPRYFAGTDEIREPHTMRPQRRPNGHKARQRLGTLPAQTYSTSTRDDVDVDGHPLGKLPGSVWRFASEPFSPPDYLVEDDRGWRFLDAPDAWQYGLLRRGEPGFAGPVMVRHVDHHAAFPSELPSRIIQGWCPTGICLACGQGRWPVVDDRRVDDRPGRRQDRDGDALAQLHPGDGRAGSRRTRHAAIVGYACACTPRTYHKGNGERSPTAGPDGRQGDRPASIGTRHRRVGGWWEYHLAGWPAPPVQPAVVLDPFCGSGTVPMVATALGRIGIGVDLNPDYARLAHWRVWESGDAHKVAARARNRPVRPLDHHPIGQGRLPL
jgi:SAM-dependent methyltransferase